ncbi:MAG: hypothetical protein ACKPKO_05035, partial [Candidatus Fonsibacter sp.]
KIDKARFEWNEERSSLTMASERALQELESRIESLKVIQRDWGYDDVDGWRGADPAHQPDAPPDAADDLYTDAHVLGNRTSDGLPGGSYSPTLVERKVDELAAISTSAASRTAALNVSIMAKAYEQSSMCLFVSVVW